MVDKHWDIAAIAYHTASPLATETAPTFGSCASAWLLWVSWGCTAAPRLTWAASGNSSRTLLPAPLATSPLRSSQTDLRWMAALLLQWKASFEDKLKGKSLREELYCFHRKWMLDYRHGSSGSRGSCRKKTGNSRMLLNPKRLYCRTHTKPIKKWLLSPFKKKKKKQECCYEYSTPIHVFWWPKAFIYTCYILNDDISDMYMFIFNRYCKFTREVVPI